MSVSIFKVLAHRLKVVTTLSLLFIVWSLHAGGQVKHQKKKEVLRRMTVAEVTPPQAGATYAEVTFKESQRVFKMPSKAARKYLKLLQESGKKRRPVLVKRASEESDVILSVTKP